MTQTTSSVPLAGRIIGSVFGFAFAGIGLTVLCFLWFADDGFGSPPLFFRIFGSFIAIVFVVMGGTMGVAALTAKPQFPNFTPPSAPAGPAHAQRSHGAFACPHCGAALTSKTEASPHGDVKCPFCGAWFNIHKRTA
jgi:hypothetical protein